MAKVILKFHINILDRPSSILHYTKCARQTTLAKRINNELDFVCVHWPLRPRYANPPLSTDLVKNFMPHLFPWNALISKITCLKKFPEPILRTLRLPRSNNLKTQNDENSKWRLVKTRWNPKFGLSDLENDLLTPMTSKGAQWIFSKITFLKSVNQAERNEL
jgi:hypothetical protein